MLPIIDCHSIISNVALFTTRDIVRAVSNFVRFSRFFIRKNMRYYLYILNRFKTCVFIFYIIIILESLLTSIVFFFLFEAVKQVKY